MKQENIENAEIQLREKTEISTAEEAQLAVQVYHYLAEKIKKIDDELFSDVHQLQVHLRSLQAKRKKIIAPLEEYQQRIRAMLASYVAHNPAPEGIHVRKKNTYTIISKDDVIFAVMSGTLPSSVIDINEKELEKFLGQVKGVGLNTPGIKVEQKNIIVFSEKGKSNAEVLEQRE